MSELLEHRLHKKHTPPPRPPVNQDGLIQTLRMMSKEIDAKIAENKSENIALSQALADLGESSADIKANISSVVNRLDALAGKIEASKPSTDPRTEELKMLERELLVKLKAALDEGF